MNQKTERKWFEEEPNRIEAKGTFSKDQMTALLHALWQTVLKYPESHFNFDIIIDGFTLGGSFLKRVVPNQIKEEKK